MNILILTREYKHIKLPSCGGTGSFYYTLAHKLKQEGHNVIVFGINKTDFFFNDKGVEIVYNKSLFRKNLIINLIRSITKKFTFLHKYHNKIHELEKKDIAKMLYAYINKNNLKIDVIETHDFEGISLMLNNSIPYVIRTHGSYSVLERYFGYKNVEIGRMHCEKLAIAKAQNIICVSNFSKKANQTIFNIKNPKIIYNGINVDLFKPNSSLKNNDKSIFFIGNLSLDKGIDIVFETFKKIIIDHPDASLHLIGRCQNFDELIIKNDLTDLASKIINYGYLTQEKTIEELNKANVVVFPSKGENFSLAILETMALEKIVITSEIDAFKEVIIHSENGFIAKKNEDYVSIINKLFNYQKNFESIKKSARKTIIEKFSLQKMYDETINYYEKIIAK